MLVYPSQQNNAPEKFSGAAGYYGWLNVYWAVSHCFKPKI
jgi:hypothetical protein